MEETLDEYYKIGQQYEGIGVLVDLLTCLEGCRSNNKTCESKCGCVQLFGSLKNRSICGYNESGEPKFEKL